MTFLERVCRALEEAGVPYGVAGGYAVALHGAPRGTLDVDLVLRLRRKDFEAAEAALKGLGLRPRLPVTAGEVFDFRLEYIEKRNLVAWSFVNADRPDELVDIVITHDLARMRTVKVRTRSGQVRVLSRADLIKMKKGAGRPQDIEDVKALESRRK